MAVKCNHDVKPHVHLGYIKALVEEAVSKVPDSAICWPSLEIDPWMYTCTKCDRMVKPVLWEVINAFKSDVTE